MAAPDRPVNLSRRPVPFRRDMVAEDRGRGERLAGQGGEGGRRVRVARPSGDRRAVPGARRPRCSSGWTVGQMSSSAPAMCTSCRAACGTSRWRRAARCCCSSRPGCRTPATWTASSPTTPSGSDPGRPVVLPGGADHLRRVVDRERLVGADLRRHPALADPVGRRRGRADRHALGRVPVDVPDAVRVLRDAVVGAARVLRAGRDPRAEQPAAHHAVRRAGRRQRPVGVGELVFASFCRSQAYQNTRLTPFAALSM